MAGKHRAEPITTPVRRVVIERVRPEVDGAAGAGRAGTQPVGEGFATGGDIPDRARLGLLTRAGARAVRTRRGKLRRGLLRLLRELRVEQEAGAACGGRPSRAVAPAGRRPWPSCDGEPGRPVGRDAPANVPGTGGKLLNWRRKAQHRVEKFVNMRKVTDTLRELDAKRKGKSAK